MNNRRKYSAAADQRFWQELEELFPKTPEQNQKWRRVMRSLSNSAATEQVWRAIPLGESKASESDRRLSDLAFLTTFVASDGVESALSRLIVAATNGAMDCFGRAALDTPGRAIELNLAAKLSLTAAALSKAFDSHRVGAQDLPVFVDDNVKPHRGLRTNWGGEPGDKGPSSFEECAASNDGSKHSKKRAA